MASVDFVRADRGPRSNRRRQLVVSPVLFFSISTFGWHLRASTCAARHRSICGGGDGRNDPWISSPNPLTYGQWGADIKKKFRNVRVVKRTRAWAIVKETRRFFFQTTTGRAFDAYIYYGNGRPRFVLYVSDGWLFPHCPNECGFDSCSFYDGISVDARILNHPRTRRWTGVSLPFLKGRGNQSVENL